MKYGILGFVVFVFVFALCGLIAIPLSLARLEIQRELETSPLTESQDYYGPAILEIQRMTRELEIINEEMRRINEVIANRPLPSFTF